MLHYCALCVYQLPPLYSQGAGCCAHSLLLSVCVCLYLHVYVDTVGRKTEYLFDPLCLSLAQQFSITSIPLLC